MEFSIFNLCNLDETARKKFHQILAGHLDGIKAKMAADEVICNYVQYFEASGQIEIADNIIDNLYSAASAGVQAGSGNQSLYLDILNAICESWKQIQ